MNKQESFEDCLKEWHLCQTEGPPKAKSNANAKAQMVKQSRRMIRLLRLMGFADEMRRINWRDVQDSIRQSSKRCEELRATQRDG